MKKLLCFCLLIIITISSIKPQSFNQNTLGWAKEWTNFNPNETVYPKAEEQLPNLITEDTYLSSEVTYFMTGDVYVVENATLTIEQGTVIRCDHLKPANLIVTQGSKLIASGSATQPIVFTSNKEAKSRAAGDWGGIKIAGSGTVNTVTGTGTFKGKFNPRYTIYGGTNDIEQTTILQYVRVEFSGNKAKGTEDTNGLSLYGLGRYSIIDNIQVSYSAQDSFSWFGGIHNMKNLISYKAEDDDFQFAEGFKGDITNVMAVRHPLVNSPKGSYAIEIEGNTKEFGYINEQELTDVVFSDAIFVNLADKRNYEHTSPAISAKNKGRLYLHKCKISGFSDVIEFDDSYTSLAVIEQSFNMDHSFYNIHGEGVKVQFKPFDSTMEVLKFNRFTEGFVAYDDLFTDPENTVAPNFALKKSLNDYLVMQ
ncbi:hypothetical protein [Aquimarina brevivitae]|uniref:Uncharacterized protein n=1 Tax=Aquimarina brevivitae TaxID=323412 RepID=A0A4Q7NZ35_9FLAO|nr:hypothetical protein [Aquimarina brevivitae]RZS92310.1 hypothetical protein EV197_2948 [Aquimarina brevivitae]